MAHGVEVAGLIITLPDWTPYAAVFVSGLAGATYAAKRGFDVVGVVGIAAATGLGGLLLRDILLQVGTPVVLADPLYIIMAAIAATIGFFFAGLIARFTPVMVILDGLAMGFMCTVGAAAAFSAGLGESSAIFIGTTTAVGGGFLRDILSGTAPRIVRPGVFVAVPAVISTSVFVFLLSAGVSSAASQLIAMAVAMALRIGSHWLGWQTGSAADLSDRVWNFWYLPRRWASHKNDGDAQDSGSTSKVTQ